jgi:predicted porin
MKLMTKLLPVAMLVGAMGTAQAQVAVYGVIDVSYGKNDNIKFGEKADFHSGGDDFSSQGNSTTRVGVKGSMDVASGIKANFKLETAGITSDGKVGDAGNIRDMDGVKPGDQPFFNRQAWFGFSGGFGEVRLGKQDSVPFQAMVDFDFNGASNAATAFGNSGVAAWGTGRQSRSLQYISPVMGGLKLQVGFVPEGNVAGDKSTFSAALNYNAGDFAAGVTSESKRTEGASSFTAFAASYDFKVAKVMASYTDGGTGAKGTGLGVVAPVAGFNIGMNYGKNSDTKADATEFFINREVYKNTFVYVDYGNFDRKTMVNPKGKAYAMGVIYAF